MVGIEKIQDAGSQKYLVRYISLPPLQYFINRHNSTKTVQVVQKFKSVMHGSRAAFLLFCESNIIHEERESRESNNMVRRILLLLHHICDAHEAACNKFSI